MSDLTVFLGEAITGRQLPEATAPVMDHLRALVQVAGSKAKAAKVIGISATTIYRWFSGRQKPKQSRTRQALASMTRRVALSKDREKKARAGMAGLTVSCTVTISKYVYVRDLRIGKWIPKGILTRIFNSWLRGQDDKADTILNHAISKYYIPGAIITEVTAVTIDGQD